MLGAMPDDEEYDPIKHGTRPSTYRYPPPVPIEESTRHQVELNRIAREIDPVEKARHEKLQRDLEKVREKKRRWRARHPYDFG